MILLPPALIEVLIPMPSVGAAHAAAAGMAIVARPYCTKVAKTEVSLFRSCTVCTGVSPETQCNAPHVVSLRLPLGVHGKREGPAPKLTCPQCWTCCALHPGPPSLLGAYAPSLSSPRTIVPATPPLPMPSVKRPRTVDARTSPGPEVFLPPALPRPFSLLGVESPGDSA